jgi:hypothetical protein
LDFDKYITGIFQRIVVSKLFDKSMDYTAYSKCNGGGAGERGRNNTALIRMFPNENKKLGNAKTICCWRLVG